MTASISSNNEYVDAVRWYLHEQGPKTKQRLTQHFDPEVEEFSILIGKLIETLQAYYARNAGGGPEDGRYVAFGLMTKGANTLMAALEIALSGYHWEGAALIRSALESFATGWDIVQDANRFTAWIARHDFESTRSLTRLKEVVPIVGRINGLLTDMGVHTKPFNSSPAVFPDGAHGKFQFFGDVPPGKEEERRPQVYVALFATFICLNVTELVFHSYSPRLETIELIPGTDQARLVVSARHRAFVDAMEAYFQALVAAGNERCGGGCR